MIALCFKSRRYSDLNSDSNYLFCIRIRWNPHSNLFTFISGLKYDKKWHSNSILSVSYSNPSLSTTKPKKKRGVETRASSNHIFPEDGNSLPGKQAVQKGNRCVMLWRTKRKRGNMELLLFSCLQWHIFFFSSQTDCWWFLLGIIRVPRAAIMLPNPPKAPTYCSSPPTTCESHGSLSCSLAPIHHQPSSKITNIPPTQKNT